MGRMLYTFRSLLPPLVRVQEAQLTIPRGHAVCMPGEPGARAVWLLEGQAQVRATNESEQPLAAGDAITVGPHTAVQYRSATAGAETELLALVVRLDVRPSEQAEAAAHGRGENPYAHWAQRLVGLQHYPAVLQRPTVSELLALIRREAENGRDASPWVVGGLCVALVADLLRETTAGAGADGSTSPQRAMGAVARARQFIVEHYQEPLTLSQIAWRVRLSGEHLGRLFKRELGCSVFEYVDRVRIDRAKQMLLTTEMPIYQIASRCGFSSSTLLGRHFKSVTGMNPLVFRRRGREREHFVGTVLEADVEGVGGRWARRPIGNQTS
jgi:AraC-like DNA-binding protein